MPPDESGNCCATPVGCIIQGYPVFTRFLKYISCPVKSDENCESSPWHPQPLKYFISFLSGSNYNTNMKIPVIFFYTLNTCRALSPPSPVPNPLSPSPGAARALHLRQQVSHCGGGGREASMDTPAAAAAAASQPAASSSAGDLTWRRSRSSFRLRASLFLLAMGLPGNLYVLHCYWSPGEEGEKTNYAFLRRQTYCVLAWKKKPSIFSIYLFFSRSHVLVLPRGRPPGNRGKQKQAPHRNKKSQ